jgi:hypothetical protein
MGYRATLRGRSPGLSSAVRQKAKEAETTITTENTEDNSKKFIRRFRRLAQI